MTPHQRGSASVLVTVDTESDNLWAAGSELSFLNLTQLPRLQELCGSYGIRPTYLVSYAVATHIPSVGIVSELAQGGECEVGAHLHAWATPPYMDGDRSGARPYLQEYEPEVQEEKLRRLTAVLVETFGTNPTSYRAGRWGLDAFSLGMLERLGYEAESSVTPWVSWERAAGARPGSHGPSFVEAPVGPYRPSVSNPCVPGNMRIWEVPVTIGPIGSGSRRTDTRWLRMIHRRQGVASRTLRKGLSQAGLVRLAWLRPLYSSVADMLALSRRAIADGLPVLNLMFHSSELIGSPNGRQGELLQDLDQYLKALFAEVRPTGMTLTEFARACQATGADDTP